MTAMPLLIEMVIRLVAIIGTEVNTRSQRDTEDVGHSKNLS